MSIDHPSVNDNRNYDFTHYPDEERKEYSVISGLIQNGATVVDLGCGNGSLLARLQKDRSARVKGVELSPSGIQACHAKGLDVIQGRIDERLPFTDNSFDYAICNVTIQMVMYPEVLLSEMKRIARFQIISFPNFAFYRNRLELMFHGVMPAHLLYGYRWYNTGHIHQLSLKDFKRLVHSIGGLVIRKLHYVKVNNPIKHALIKTFSNLLMPIPIILLEKTGQSHLT
jgi:methionine biosynthesis protein MetW